MHSRRCEALRTAFPAFGWREVGPEGNSAFAFVVEALDGTPYGAVP